MTIYKALLYISAGILFLVSLAAVHFPYGVTLFFRITVCGLAVYSAFLARDNIVVVIGLLFIAVLFNPFVSISLTQPAKRIIELATVATFIRLAIRPIVIEDKD